jgi:hypothetical protein
MVVPNKVYTRTVGHDWAWHRNPARSTAEVPNSLGMCADRVILRGVIKRFSKRGSCQN